jgi:hypothetical protein
MRELHSGVAIAARWRELNQQGVDADRAGHTGSNGCALSWVTPSILAKT